MVLVFVSFPLNVRAAGQTDTVSKAAQNCSVDQIRELLRTDTLEPFILPCSATLSSDARVTRQVIIEGSAASATTFNCNGAVLDGSGLPESSEVAQLLVRSKPTTGIWDRPSDVTIQNCRFLGSAKVYGLGLSGNAKRVRESSLNADHTNFAQASAPTRILFSNVIFETTGRLPLYLAPGVTAVTVRDSSFIGRVRTVAIYLDAESAGNRIEGNVFEISSEKRELIAVDGSANNIIQRNTFSHVKNGGVFLYRNCGEGGTIRHQTPHGNLISGNLFVIEGGKPAVWLNSRNGNSNFCFIDPKHPFGSSLSSLDYAKNNTVVKNVVVGAGSFSIKNNDPSNVVANNVFE